LRDGLRLAEQIGCKRIYIEADYLEVVNALFELINHKIVGMIILDEDWLIMARFESARLAHCVKEANKTFTLSF
jgi:hypothetical protein